MVVLSPTGIKSAKGECVTYHSKRSPVGAQNGAFCLLAPAECRFSVLCLLKS